MTEACKTFFDNLLTLQTSLDEEAMELIFGKTLGNHLYEKFERFDRNIVFLYSALDEVNKLLLLQYYLKMSSNGE